MCLDWTDEMQIWGDTGAADYQRVEMLFMPCNYIHSHLGYDQDSVSDECI